MIKEYILVSLRAKYCTRHTNLLFIGDSESAGFPIFSWQVCPGPSRPGLLGERGLATGGAFFQYLETALLTLNRRVGAADPMLAKPSFLPLTIPSHFLFIQNTEQTEATGAGEGSRAVIHQCLSQGCRAIGSKHDDH